jgi:hypothetical protein
MLRDILLPIQLDKLDKVMDMVVQCYIDMDSNEFEEGKSIVPNCMLNYNQSFLMWIGRVLDTLNLYTPFLCGKQCTKKQLFDRLVMARVVVDGQIPTLINYLAGEMTNDEQDFLLLFCDRLSLKCTSNQRTVMFYFYMLELHARNIIDTKNDRIIISFKPLDWEDAADDIADDAIATCFDVDMNLFPEVEEVIDYYVDICDAQKDSEYQRLSSDCWDLVRILTLDIPVEKRRDLHYPMSKDNEFLSKIAYVRMSLPRLAREYWNSYLDCSDGYDMLFSRRSHGIRDSSTYAEGFYSHYTIDMCSVAFIVKLMVDINGGKPVTYDFLRDQYYDDQIRADYQATNDRNIAFKRWQPFEVAVNLLELTIDIHTGLVFFSNSLIKDAVNCCHLGSEGPDRSYHMGVLPNIFVHDFSFNHICDERCNEFDDSLGFIQSTCSVDFVLKNSDEIVYLKNLIRWTVDILKEKLYSYFDYSKFNKTIRSYELSTAYVHKLIDKWLETFKIGKNPFNTDVMPLLNRVLIGVASCHLFYCKHDGVPRNFNGHSLLLSKRDLDSGGDLRLRLRSSAMRVLISVCDHTLKPICFPLDIWKMIFRMLYSLEIVVVGTVSRRMLVEH